MNISKEDIINVNKKFGGTPLSDASIEFALEAGKNKSLYTQIALLTRAILVDHPFIDGNKRTALNVAFIILERNKIRLDKTAEERLTKELMKLARNTEHSIKKIERGIRYAIEGR